MGASRLKIGASKARRFSIAQRISFAAAPVMNNAKGAEIFRALGVASDPKKKAAEAAFQRIVFAKFRRKAGAA